MIEICDLRKSYGNHVAVDDLNFKVESGEILGLVGPNGAGKTTTMRCMTGIIPADSGSIVIKGHSLREDPVAAKGLMAFVPAEVRLFDHLTVYEHLIFFRRLYQNSDAPVKDADEMIAELDLTAKRDQLPGALSRGMKQKLMIGCALIHTPDVLIMDEPFTGLDPHAIRAMRKLLVARAEAGCSVVISSHLLGMVEDFVTRILIIQNGKRVAMGDLAELQSSMGALHEDADLEEIFIKITGQPAEEQEI